ncbi:MAG: hypothetical protein ABL921_11900 [Pirellula sp.]
MTDIKNVRLLWIKGGLFLLLGCVASGLVLLQAQNMGVVVLFAIAVWAFCRAYYFAFYVIEKFADSSFRFTGLTSIAHYCIVGPDQYRQSQESRAGQECDEFIDANPVGNIRWLAIKWFAFAIAVNLLAPLVYRESISNRGLGREIVGTAFIGWSCVNVSVCVMAAALWNAPLKYRVPLSSAVLVLLTISVAIGQMSFRIPAVEAIFVLLAYATSIFLLGTILFWIYRRTSGKFFEIDGSATRTTEQSPNSNNEQISLRYIFAATIIVAIALTFIKSLSPRIPSQPVTFIAYLFIIGCAIIACVWTATIIDMHIIFSNCFSPHSKWLVILLLICLATFPFAIMLAVSALPTPSGVPRIPAQTWREYRPMYIFFASYTAMLSVILITFMRAGVRLVRRSS